MTTLFYLSALVAVIATVMVIVSFDAVRALLYMIVSLLSVGLVLFSFGAELAAVLEVIIYAGAIMVLFVFVIMMLGLGRWTAQRERMWLSPGVWFGPSILTLILAAELTSLMLSGSADSPVRAVVGPKEVGMSLFGPYLLGVELASMLLMAALVGAYHLSLKDEHSSENGGLKP